MRGKTNSFDRSSLVTLSSKSAGNVWIIGEKLRHEFNSSDPSLIQDRRYRLRAYQKCFVGNEAVSWVLKHKDVTERSAAVQMMNVLMKYNVIHHVYDDHLFKDEMLFFRFRVDDGSFPEMKGSQPYITGAAVYHRVKNDTSSNPLLKLHAEYGHKYPESFYGAELVSWLLKSGMCCSREEGLRHGKDLLGVDIIQHVTLDHHFKDERMLYQFNPLVTELGITDLLTLDVEQEAGRSLSGEAAMLSLPADSVRTHSNSSSSDSSIDKTWGTGSRPDMSRPDMGSPDQNQNRLPGPPGALDSPDTPSKTFLDPSGGCVGADELRQPHGSFIKQHIKIAGDSVGFGLVIRGDGPTYVQTVDPKGPAAAAGLKVKQYLAVVNGVDVLDKSHDKVAKLILSNPYELSLVVMKSRDETVGT